MKRILSVIAASSFSLSNLMPALAIDVVPSNSNLRFSKSSPSQSFTVTLSDDLPEKYSKKSGFLKAKLKFDKKLFETNLSKNTIEIPYVNGEVRNSGTVTITLKDPDAFSASTSKKFDIKLPKKFKKKLGINNLSGDLGIDVGGINLKGKVIAPKGVSGAAAQIIKARKVKPNDVILTPFNTDLAVGASVELHEVNPDGTTNPEVIATTTTDSHGEYELTMPEDADMGHEYVVVAPNVGDAPLEALVSDSEELVIDAVSTFVEHEIAERKAEGDEGIENINPHEIETMLDDIRDFNFGTETTVTASVERLDSALDAVVDNMIEVAEDEEIDLNEGNAPDDNDEDFFDDDDFDDKANEPKDPDDEEFAEDHEIETEFGERADNFAGDNYFVVFYEGAMSGVVDDSIGYFDENSISAELELGEALVSKPSAAGIVDIFPLPVFASEATMLRTKDNGEGGDHHNEPPPPEGDQVEPPPEGDAPVDNTATEEGDEHPEGGDEHHDGGEHYGPQCFEIEAFSGNDFHDDDDEFKLFGTIDTNDVLTVIEPAEEDVFVEDGQTFVFRDKDEVFKFYPVGEDMYLGSTFGGSEQYEQTSGTLINEDAVMGFNTVIKKSDDLSLDTIQGNYGLVGFGIDLAGGEGRIGLLSVLGPLTISGSDVTASFDEVEISREPVRETSDCCDYTVSTQSEGEHTGAATFSIVNHKIEIDFSHEDEEADENETEIFQGYARPDGDVLMFVSTQDRDHNGDAIDHDRKRRGNRKRIDSAGREYNIAVKLASSAPSVDGKTYKLLSYDVALNTTGGVTFSNYADSATMSFAGTTASFSGLTLNNVTKSTCESSMNDSTSTIADSSAPATIGTDGSITMDFNGKSFKGYVSEDASLIVMRASDSSSMGLYVAILQK